MKEHSFLVIDFDSTFIKLETLDEIAQEALRSNSEKNRIQKEIKKITRQGMLGEVSFSDSLKNRLKLFLANRKEIEKVSQKIKKNISDSFFENKEFFKRNGRQIFVISGGFKDCIFPVSDEFGIPRENIFANEFIFDENGQVAGIDDDNLLSKNQGKVRQLKSLGITGMIFVVGDGWTDYEIKKEY